MKAPPLQLRHRACTAAWQQAVALANVPADMCRPRSLAAPPPRQIPVVAASSQKAAYQLYLSGPLRRAARSRAEAKLDPLRKLLQTVPAPKPGDMQTVSRGHAARMQLSSSFATQVCMQSVREVQRVQALARPCDTACQVSTRWVDACAPDFRTSLAPTLCTQAPTQQTAFAKSQQKPLAIICRAGPHFTGPRAALLRCSFDRKVPAAAVSSAT